MLNTFLQTYLHLISPFLSVLAILALLELPAQLILLHIEKTNRER